MIDPKFINTIFDIYKPELSAEEIDIILGWFAYTQYHSTIRQDQLDLGEKLVKMKKRLG